jgi:Na+/H+-dicarboxylate symporter
MKIWIKYLLALILGTLLGLYLLDSSAADGEALPFAAELVLHIGRYAVYPLVFFSLAYASFKLRMEHRVLGTYLKSILAAAVSGVLLTLIGLGAVLLLSPERIPIIIETERAYSFPGYREILFSVFPDNLFRIFRESGDFLLPVGFFAVFLGLNFSFDKVVTRPAVELFDSLSRIFYHIGKFVLEILGLGLIVLSAYFVVSLRATEELDLFNQLVLLLALLAAFIILGVYPVLFYFLSGRENPYKQIYALLGPLLTAAVSGNGYFSYISLASHTRENLGVKRETGASTLPFFTLFGKAGTAMVTAVTFVVILRSYSSLGIGWEEVLWIFGFSLLSSLLAGSVPGMGVIVSLAAMCGLYGGGLENGFLIVVPILPILSGFAVLLDVLTAGLASRLIAGTQDDVQEIYAGEYI